jgi:ATP-binding cassette, subfamily B, bacterial PglK
VTPERRRAYRRLYGYVPQSIFLVDDSITRNVALGIPDDEVDMAAVEHACRSAQILEFIEQELPDGFDTVVGERGVRLSGGQRQRIGIARALYHQPAILVFDEATSALDVHTEHLVYEAFEGLAREHTLITVAHRLATVRQADHVVVLEQGRVVDQGPPEAVLDRFEMGAGLQVS